MTVALPSFLRNPLKARRIDEQFSARLPMHGAMDAWLKDPVTGRIVDHRHVPNTIVDAGETWVAELLGREEVGGGVLGTPLSSGLQFIAVGTDGTAVTQNDFKLGSLVGTNGCLTIDTKDIAPNNVLTVATTFGVGDGNGALQEAGIFAADCDTTEPTSETDTVNRMFNRTTFGTITKSTSFTLTLQWTITIGALSA